MVFYCQEYEKKVQRTFFSVHDEPSADLCLHKNLHFNFLFGKIKKYEKRTEKERLQNGQGTGRGQRICRMENRHITLKKERKMIMKYVKKIVSVLVMAVMMVTMSVTAFAQESESGAEGSGSITIRNASKGVHYTIYKVFDAKVNADGTSVAYIKEELVKNPYFKKDSAGNISATDAIYEEGSQDKLSEGAIEWIKSNGKEICSKISNGSVLKITGLPYGYYYVSSTLKEGGAIMVTSVAPDVEIVDKNSNEPQWTPGDGENEGGKSIVLTGNKLVKENDVNIGEAVKFRLQINTSDYVGEKQIMEYIIEDDLPAGFEMKQITSVTVDGTQLGEFKGKQFPIRIPWADQTEKDGWKSRYNTGVKLVIDYTAVLNENAVLDGEGNRNCARFSWNYTDHDTAENPDQPDGSSTEDFTITDTYAIILQKVDDKGRSLTGVTFEVPFPISGENGVYTVRGGQTGTGEVEAGADGMVIIKGLKTGAYSIREIEAPEGYNRLTEPFIVTVEKTGASKTDSVVYLDENGNITDHEADVKVTYKNDDFAAKVQVVVNKSGKLLPGTGGIGETIFTVGGMLVAVMAGIILIVSKKYNKRV